MSDQVEVVLSNGKAFLKSFVDNETATKYKDIINKGIMKSVYEPTEKEMEEIEALPIHERIKAKQALSVDIPIENVNSGMDFLAKNMIAGLEINGEKKHAFKDCLNAMSDSDFNLIRDKAAEIWLEHSGKENDKKKS